MTTIDTIAAAAGAYAVAAALITMLPGPDTAVVLATAIDGGRRAAARAAFGVATGLLFWALAASVGLATLLRASAELYGIFRLVCVAYLLWLAARSVRAMVTRRVSGMGAATSSPSRFRIPWGYRRALLTAVLNPKLGVFFVVFLPQFIPEGVPAFGMTMLFGSIQAAEALIWYLALGSIAGAARAALTRPAVRRTLDGLAAGVFAFFGGRLALDA